VIIGAEVAKKAATAGPEAGKHIGGQAETAADAANQNTHASAADLGGRASEAPPHRTPPPNAPSGPPAGSDSTKPPRTAKE
jgi:DNA processing protein